MVTSLRTLVGSLFLSLLLLSGCSASGGTASKSARTYWITETNLNIHVPGGKVSWDLKVVERGNKEADTPATDVTVFAELQDSTGAAPLSGTVGEDGWVRWERDFPELETKLFVTDIQGDLEWNTDDRAFAKTHSALAYKDDMRLTQD